MVYCVIVVLLLAFITAVCSNEVSGIGQLFHENLYALCKEISQRFNIVYKGFPCNISQQVILQNTFPIYMIFQVDDSGNCDFKSSNEEIFPEILTG